VALDSGALSSAIQSVFESRGTASATADGIAFAYYDYASDATFGASVPTIPPENEDAMAATILSAISDPDTGSPANFGAAFTSALPTFWAAVPVAGASGAGATSGCPGASAGGSAIATAVTGENTAASAASAMATALDTATKTVPAALGPPTSATVTAL
jgi:hypothetical protein